MLEVSMDEVISLSDEISKREVKNSLENRVYLEVNADANHYQKLLQKLEAKYGARLWEYVRK